jgi:hypothetical protein
MENNNLIGGSTYDKSTYIGHLKLNNGGMKVIKGKTDDKIIKNRDKILSNLNKVLSGGKKLKDHKLEKYFNALNGQYIRNDMCIDNIKCKYQKDVSIGGAHKLLKLVKQTYEDINPILERFKTSAPILYERLEYKINGGNIRNTESSISSKSSVSPISRKIKKINTTGGLYDKFLSNNMTKSIIKNISKYMKGGDADLEKLRFKLNRYNLRDHILAIEIE